MTRLTTRALLALAVPSADGKPLRACVNQAVSALDADGTLDALARQWLAQEGRIKTITR